MTQGKFFLKCFLAAVAAVFFFSWITMLLWNWLVPVLFGGPIISFTQALGLLLLTKILTFGLGGRKHWNQDQACASPPWKQRFYEKMSSLSPGRTRGF